jgi:hypothetical protein
MLNNTKSYGQIIKEELNSKLDGLSIGYKLEQDQVYFNQSHIDVVKLTFICMRSGKSVYRILTNMDQIRDIANSAIKELN